MDYDRRVAALPRLDSVLHKASEADEAIGTAYRALASFKAGFDAMEEIPHSLHAIYDQTTKALSEVADVRRHTAQVREMAKRLPR